MEQKSGSPLEKFARFLVFEADKKCASEMSDWGICQIP